VNNTFLQPFLSYVTPAKTTYTINSESSYNWTASQWTLPINVSVFQLVMMQGQPVQFQLGARYYADAPTNGPEWGLRLGVTLLFPN